MGKSTTRPDAKSDVLSGFAERMNELCEDWQMPEAKRQTLLGTKFKVTPNTARKWLLGLGFPEMEMCIQIAKEAKVNIRWLLQGEGLKNGDKGDPSAETLKSAIDDMPQEMRQASFDFIEYQLTKADGFIPAAKLASYIKLMEHLKKTPKGSPKED